MLSKNFHLYFQPRTQSVIIFYVIFGGIVKCNLLTLILCTGSVMNQEPTIGFWLCMLVFSFLNRPFCVCCWVFSWLEDEKMNQARHCCALNLGAYLNKLAWKRWTMESVGHLIGRHQPVSKNRNEQDAWMPDERNQNFIVQHQQILLQRMEDWALIVRPDPNKCHDWLRIIQLTVPDSFLSRKNIRLW